MAWTGATLHDECHSEPEGEGRQVSASPTIRWDSERGEGLRAGRPCGARPKVTGPSPLVAQRITRLAATPLSLGARLDSFRDSLAKEGNSPFCGSGGERFNPAWPVGRGSSSPRPALDARSPAASSGRTIARKLDPVSSTF